MGTNPTLLRTLVQEYLKDNFTDADLTSLASHVMDTGPGWTLQNGSQWRTNGNKAECNNTGTGAHVLANAGVSDCTIQATLNISAASSNRHAIAMRETDKSNYWWASIDTGNNFQLNETSGASTTTRASATPTISTGTDYEIKAVLSGSNITCTLNGANTLSYGSATTNQTITTHGLRTGGPGLQCTWDNFMVS